MLDLNVWQWWSFALFQVPQFQDEIGSFEHYNAKPTFSVHKKLTKAPFPLHQNI